jgi:hypothetical protein
MPDRRWLLAVLTAVAMLVLGGVGAARADWPLAGVRVAGPANLRTVLADGAGGAFVVFTPPGDSLRVLRISADGSIARMAAAGRGVATPTISVQPPTGSEVRMSFVAGSTFLTTE